MSVRNVGQKPPVPPGSVERALNVCLDALRPLSLRDQYRVLNGVRAYIQELPETASVPHDDHDAKDWT